MNNKVIVLFSIFLLIIASGCLDEQNTAIQDDYVSSYEYAAPSESEMAKVDTAGSSGAVDILDRKIISTASLTMEVKNTENTFKEITQIVQTSGGFISSSSIYEVSGRNNGEITVKVPQKKFHSSIEQIEALGTVKSKQISGQDVTEEFIDLNARLGNLKKQETRLQEILNMATTVTDVLDVEYELERVRGEIERLTGRLNFINQSVEMSTISIRAREPTPITGGGGFGFIDALKEGLAGFIESVYGIIIFIGYMLPIALFVAVVILVAVWIKRKVMPRLFA